MSMTKKNWDRIADKEYAALDTETQRDWAELRKRVNHFAFKHHVRTAN